MVTVKGKLLRLTFGLVLILVGGAFWVGFAPGIQLGAAEQKPASSHAAPPGQEDSKLKELLKERLAVLREVSDIRTAQYRAGFGGEEAADRARQAEQAVFDAELELCETDKERITVLEKMVAEAKQYERRKSESKRRTDVLMAKGDRLKTEIALERVKSKTAARPN